MQATSDKTASANFTQTGGTANARGIAVDLTNGKTGYNNYYQWGRKDAFRSSQYTAAPAANTSLVYSATSVTVGTTIKNPTTHYAYGGGTGANVYANPYNSNVYYNAWNATYTSYSTATTKADGLEKTIKTVYDPCPVGYTVPPANTFYGFTKSNFPISGSGRQYTSGGKILYFPFIGRRGYTSGGLEYLGEQGIYWSAVSGAANYARSLYFNSSDLNPADCTDGHSRVRSNGLPIRPVREN